MFTRHFNIQKTRWHQLRFIIIYGLGIGVLVSILRWLDYRHFLHTLSAELYLGFIALVFAIAGIWVGSMFRNHPKPIAENTIEVRHQSESVASTSIDKKTSTISKRELDVLQLMSSGLTNQEIADTLFVSLNTVKTHISNLYLKLEVRRRTQAVQKARDLGIIRSNSEITS